MLPYANAHVEDGVSSFEGKVAIITGAAQGLGEGYARAFAAEGAVVVIFDVQTDKARQVASELANGSAIVVDVADRMAVANAVQQVKERHGHIDILINNAAVASTAASRSKPWYELPQEDWDRTMAVNLGGAWNCCSAVVPIMIAQASGKIVNVSSSTFWQPPGQLLHYITTKGGLIAFTRSLARELGQHGINVNAIAPGLTRTEALAHAYSDEYFRENASRRSIPRIEQPSDLVGTVLYLCSPASDFVTGQVILVDGGESFD